MRFIHTSDWQLGKPFGRLPDEARAALQEARLDAIDRLAASARGAGASTILVAGDVFDNSEPGDHVYRQALTRMKAAADVRWMLLPGNHDPARPTGCGAGSPANRRAMS
jgi:DNA repair exonuclease SbcCD nuclease subunit